MKRPQQTSAFNVKQRYGYFLVFCVDLNHLINYWYKCEVMDVIKLDIFIEMVHLGHHWYFCINHVWMAKQMKWNLICSNNYNVIPSSLKYKSHFSRRFNCWSLRCSWSIACRFPYEPCTGMVTLGQYPSVPSGSYPSGHYLPRTIPTRKLPPPPPPPPPDNTHSDITHLGQYPLGHYPPGTIPTRTLPIWDNTHSDITHLGQYSPGH